MGRDIINKNDNANLSHSEGSYISYDSEEMDDGGADDHFIRKLYLFWKNMLLIKPNNQKLKYFHLVVAIVLYFDFYLTGCMFANYRYTHKLKGYNKMFMDN